VSEENAEGVVNGKRSRMLGNVQLLYVTSLIPETSGRADNRDTLLQFTSGALLAVIQRHQLTVAKFGGAIICEGCGELVGPDGALCEELQVIWDKLYPGDQPKTE